MRLRILLLLCLTVSLASCVVLIFAFAPALEIPAPEIRVTDVRLLEEETKVSDFMGNGFSAVGYLLFTLESDTDLIEAVKEHDVILIVEANTCETRIEMDGFRPYPLSRHSYQVLVDYKRDPRELYRGKKRPSYNLATHPEDICIFVMYTKMPHPRIESNEVRYPLNDALRETLRAYEQQGGAVRSERLPDCPDLHCSPYYKSIFWDANTAFFRIAMSLSSYKKDFGHYPTTEEGLAKLKPNYYQYMLLDRWEEPFIYLSPDPAQGEDSFLLYSKGPNKIDEQGLGDDIVYRSEAAK